MGFFDKVLIGGKIILYLLIILTLYFLIHGLVIYFSGKLPPDWWPDWIKKIVYKAPDVPKGYKYMSNVYSPGATVSNTFTQHSEAQCLAECGDGCIGVMTQPSSNTCSTLSTVSYPISYTGNNLFVVEGNEPSKMYAAYQSNTVDTYTTTTIPTSIETNYFNCASNCTSNSTCSGFVFNTTTGLCTMYPTMSSSNLTSTTTNFTSYILGSSAFIGSPFS
jgi:hypothetical protein